MSLLKFSKKSSCVDNNSFKNLISVRKYDFSFSKNSLYKIPEITKKLIKRKIDVFCRRNTFVELTAKGKKVLEKNINLIYDVLVKAFGSELNNTIDFLIEVGKKLNLVQSERGDLNACVE